MSREDITDRSKSKSKKPSKEQMIYLWLLQHTWNSIELPTPMEAWDAENSTWERGRLELSR